MLKRTHLIPPSPHDIQKISGTENEEFIVFDTSDGTDFPLRISVCGITPPSPNYYIKRFPVRGFILEHIVEGKGYVVVDGKKYTVNKGDTYLLKIGENCEYFSDKKDPYKKLWVNVFGSFAHEIVSQYQLKDTVYQNVDLSDLFEKLFALEHVSTVLSVVHHKISAIVTEMFLRLAQSSSHPKQANAIARQIHEAIVTSVNLPFSLDELAKSCFLSKSELIRHFKKGYGKTPYKFLTELRISHAKNLLKNTDFSIAKIADFLHFADPYYFSNVFKQYVGIPPSEYRKSL